jgi:hypothetical protein
MATKKILVPYDLDNPKKDYNVFLYPNINSLQNNSFIEIGKDKEWKVGRVVFVGKTITKNDVFAKIVDSGVRIESVNKLLHQLDEYLNQISSFKIGDIVGIRYVENSFDLFNYKKTIG